MLSNYLKYPKLKNSTLYALYYLSIILIVTVCIGFIFGASVVVEERMTTMEALKEVGKEARKNHNLDRIARFGTKTVNSSTRFATKKAREYGEPILDGFTNNAFGVLNYMGIQ